MKNPIAIKLTKLVLLVVGFVLVGALAHYIRLLLFVIPKKTPYIPEQISYETSSFRSVNRDDFYSDDLDPEESTLIMDYLTQKYGPHNFEILNFHKVKAHRVIGGDYSYEVPNSCFADAKLHDPDQQVAFRVDCMNHENSLAYYTADVYSRSPSHSRSARQL